CFVLKHLEQWRLEEIAEQLDSSLGSVKQALFRALRKLRDALQAWRSPT
ncbi:MAG: sigma-70 region 4 domain-containing protein, partial [Xanthomonadales bacterium]|nr:sigma-70 region 4 domain-containing protein [Xanthomonadales bacterium]